MNDTEEIETVPYRSDPRLRAALAAACMAVVALSVAILVVWQVLLGEIGHNRQKINNLERDVTTLCAGRPLIGPCVEATTTTTTTMTIAPSPPSTPTTARRSSSPPPTTTRTTMTTTTSPPTTIAPSPSTTVTTIRPTTSTTSCVVIGLLCR